MAMYEPIRGHDEEEEKKKRGVECCSIDGDGDVVVDDVEMAIHSRSSASATSKIEDEEGSKQRRLHQHQPSPKPLSQRLVSLDVFRGLTVAVIYSFLFFVFHFSFVCYSFIPINNYEFW